MFGFGQPQPVAPAPANTSQQEAKAPATPSPSKEDLELESQLMESKQTVDFSNFLNNNKHIVKEDGDTPLSEKDKAEIRASQQKATEEFFASKQFNSITTDLYEKMQQGDVDGFNEALSNSFRNVFKESMISAGKMIDNRFATMDDLITKRLESQTKSASLMQNIKSRIPLAQNPKFSSLVLSQVKENIASGMKEAEAISAVRALFSDMQMESVPKSERPRTSEEFDDLFK